MNSTEIKRHLTDEELLSFGYMPTKTPAQSRLYTPGDPITREMISDYYHKIAGYLLPYIIERPQFVKRQLTFDAAFFLKEGTTDIPGILNQLKGTPPQKDMVVLTCNNAASFSFLIDSGIVELNLWHSSMSSLDNPDYLVLDLDPSEQNSFSQVKRVAKIVRTILDKAGAESFCKTSGAAGLHVLIPLGMRYPYSVIQDFAYTICMLTNKKIPEITSLDKKKSGKEHKIFLDYTQNSRGKSLVAVYSVRDLPGAPVSTPIAWEELTDELNPYDFNIFTVPERVKKSGDLYTGLLNDGINIRQCLQNLGSV
jgi:bifunctional non-homologous end joining protein LigD